MLLLHCCCCFAASAWSTCLSADVATAQAQGLALGSWAGTQGSAVPCALRLAIHPPMFVLLSPAQGLAATEGCAWVSGQLSPSERVPLQQVGGVH